MSIHFRADSNSNKPNYTKPSARPTNIMTTPPVNLSDESSDDAPQREEKTTTGKVVEEKKQGWFAKKWQQFKAWRAKRAELKAEKAAAKVKARDIAEREFEYADASTQTGFSFSLLLGLIFLSVFAGTAGYVACLQMSGPKQTNMIRLTDEQVKIYAANQPQSFTVDPRDLKTLASMIKPAPFTEAQLKVIGDNAHVQVALNSDDIRRINEGVKAVLEEQNKKILEDMKLVKVQIPIDLAADIQGTISEAVRKSLANASVPGVTPADMAKAIADANALKPSGNTKETVIETKTTTVGLSDADVLRVAKAVWRVILIDRFTDPDLKMGGKPAEVFFGANEDNSAGLGWQFLEKKE